MYNEQKGGKMTIDNILWQHPEGMESKGSILLVHGTSAMNIDGNVPGVTKEQYPLGNMSAYKQLADRFAQERWSTLRYTRRGVHNDHIDWEEYNQVDLPEIMEQLNRLFHMMPSDKPRIIFCWSGGSIHVTQMPLDQADGLVILGGIATTRYHMALSMAKDKEQYKQYLNEIQSVENMTYEEVLEENGPNQPDGPFVKFWQENNLDDNWTYLKPHVDLPVLILHGTADEEAPFEQSLLWKQLLPIHNITFVEQEGGDHFMQTDHANGADVVMAATVNWLNNSVL